MHLFTYVLGSMYIMRSIFRFSHHVTNYMYNQNIINLPIYKFEKINECIYSSIHGLLVTGTTFFSVSTTLFDSQNTEEKDNELQYLITSLSFSYFWIDLVQCIYYKKYLFLLHHLAALHLLTCTFYSYYNQENKGFYAMYFIFLLESNTILLNIGFLLKELKFHYSITCTSWIVHLFFFILFRLIMMPRILFIYYYNEYMNFHRLTEIPSFILILSGSFYWAYRQTIGIQKYLKENSVL